MVAHARACLAKRQMGAALPLHMRHERRSDVCYPRRLVQQLRFVSCELHLVCAVSAPLRLSFVQEMSARLVLPVAVKVT